MINNTIDFFENTGERCGVSIKIPRPNQKTMRACAITNGVVGTALILSGIKTRKNYLIFFGLLSMAGAYLLTLEQDE